MRTADIWLGALVLLLWGGASMLCGVAVSFVYGQSHRWCRRTWKRWEKPELDLIFVTFTLVAFPFVPWGAGIIADKLTIVHVLEPVIVYSDAFGQTNLASLTVGSRLEFRGIEEGKSYRAFRVRLSDGRKGFILHGGRTELRFRWERITEQSEHGGERAREP